MFLTDLIIQSVKPSVLAKAVFLNALIVYIILPIERRTRMELGTRSQVVHSREILSAKYYQSSSQLLQKNKRTTFRLLLFIRKYFTIYINLYIGCAQLGLTCCNCAFTVFHISLILFCALEILDLKYNIFAFLCLNYIFSFVFYMYFVIQDLQYFSVARINFVCIMFLENFISHPLLFSKNLIVLFFNYLMLHQLTVVNLKIH